MDFYDSGFMVPELHPVSSEILMKVTHPVACKAPHPLPIQLYAGSSRPDATSSDFWRSPNPVYDHSATPWIGIGE
jgi:hypothetical protein